MPQLKLSESEIRQGLETLPDWKVGSSGSAMALTRSFRFSDFAQAQVFANKVGALAEARNHHPEIVLSWGRVQVRWWTHDCQGLSTLDMDMAAETDLLMSNR